MNVLLHAPTCSVSCRSYSRKMDTPISLMLDVQRSLKSCWLQWMSLCQVTPSQSLPACRKCLHRTALMQRCSPSLCRALTVLQQIADGIRTVMWMRTVIPIWLHTAQGLMHQALRCSRCRRIRVPQQSTRCRVCAQPKIVWNHVKEHSIL